MIHRLNFLVERVFLLYICVLGNWSLYYLVAVLLFDASFNDLKQYLYVLLAQIVASLFLLLRMDLKLGANLDRRWTLPALPAGPRLYRTIAVAGAAAVLAVGAVHYLKLSQTPLPYNLAWALLLPLVLALGTDRSTKSSADPVTLAQQGWVQALDILLVPGCAVFLAISLYGFGFPTPDDAYYGYVMSSVLAHPEQAVLGQDNLMGSGAPFVVHPAYRPVGYEVLIALLGDAVGVPGLQLYYEVMPSLAAVFWVLFAYLFMRCINVPLPGLAVATCLLAMLSSALGFTPGAALAFLHWGKSQLLLYAAPLLFVCVAVFAANSSFASWALLLLAVAATTTLSSSAVFITPVSVGLAALVFVPSLLRWQGIRQLLLIGAALSPVLVALAYTFWMLAQVDISSAGFNAGVLRVRGQAFGGVGAQVVALLILVLLMPMAATAGGERFRQNMQRICLVGFFTVLTPYLPEVLALVSGSSFLGRRIQFAFPTALLIGVLGSLLVVLLCSSEVKAQAGKMRLALAGLGVAAALAFALTLPVAWMFGFWRGIVPTYTDDYFEAVEARQLLPDGGLVAAADLDEFLPMLPNPPTFVVVRHYIDYYKAAFGRTEHRQRKELYQYLITRRPLEGETLPEAIDKVIAHAEALSVTSLVFHTPGGRVRLEANLKPRDLGRKADMQDFVEALVARLEGTGHVCMTTPAAKTWVCNRLED